MKNKEVVTTIIDENITSNLENNNKKFDFSMEENGFIKRGQVTVV